MTFYIGIDYHTRLWKICVRDQSSEEVDLRVFADVSSLLTALEQISTRSKVACIAFSSPFKTTFGPLNATPGFELQEIMKSSDEAQRHDIQSFLIGMCQREEKSYRLPAIQYLQTVPAHRPFYRAVMGGSNWLCALTTLLYRMRSQQASWSEMSFFLLGLEQMARSLLVVRDGSVVDGIYTDLHFNIRDTDRTRGREGEEEVETLAFWESLMQDLAGLMALHHLEDIVVLDDRSTASNYTAQQTVIDRLSDLYQIYLFPQKPSDPEGFQSAIGAAILAEGLTRPGLAAEVVEHLHLSALAQAEELDQQGEP